MQQKGSFLPIFGVIILILIVGTGAYYFGKSSNRITTETSKPSSQSPQLLDTSQKQVTPAISPTVDETASWKTFTNKDYSFKYPSDWHFDITDYLNSTTVQTPSKMIAITISEGTWPFGFGGDMNAKMSDLEVEVSGKKYQVKETIIEDSTVFYIITTNSSKGHKILVGTITATGRETPNGRTALEEYQDSKETILKILSTFRFL